MRRKFGSEFGEEDVPRMPRAGDVTCTPAENIAAVACDPASAQSFAQALSEPARSHRDKLTSPYPFFACVARPVGRKEIEGSEKAQAAMREEWAKLEKNGVFDMSTVKSWHKVRDAARKKRGNHPPRIFGYYSGGKELGVTRGR